MEPRVLTYETKGDGEPVVLVPGGLTGWMSWIPHAQAMAGRWTTIRVQPIHNELGSAGRRADPSYTFETEREALRMTLDHLGLDRPHLAGWSGGGRALIEFALAYPERVRTLTLVEPAGYWFLQQTGEQHDEVEGVDAFMATIAGRDVSEDDLARFLVLAGFVPSQDAASQHPSWPTWLQHRNALSWQSRALDPTTRSVEDLARITVRTLLVKGTVTSVWLRDVVDLLAARLPDATVLELEGGHACHIESIGDFLPAFEKHLLG